MSIGHIFPTDSASRDSSSLREDHASELPGLWMSGHAAPLGTGKGEAET